MRFVIDLEIFLKGVQYGNNTMVYLNSIGERSEALMCLTPCCPSHELTESSWQLPDGMTDSSRGDGWNITKRPGALLLHRQNNFVPSPGVYTCIIPDINFESRHLYILGYTTNTQPGK